MAAMTVSGVVVYDAPVTVMLAGIIIASPYGDNVKFIGLALMCTHEPSTDKQVITSSRVSVSTPETA